MCITDGHDITLAVEVVLNPNTTNHPANIDQLAQRGQNNCMTDRSQMSSIMSPLGLERPHLFALELGTIAELDLVYTIYKY